MAITFKTAFFGGTYLLELIYILLKEVSVSNNTPKRRNNVQKHFFPFHLLNEAVTVLLFYFYRCCELKDSKLYNKTKCMSVNRLSSSIYK